MIRFLFCFYVFMALVLPAHAEPAVCADGTDRACLFDLLDKSTSAVTEDQWRDSTYREMAKLLTADGQGLRALPIISRIKNPDTQAMTVRGIGMAAADLKLPKDQYDTLFAGLRAEADKITDPPSHAIALTYIAMAQAFAGDDAGAWKTAGEMENAALRHKAFGETGEIQAERGDLKAVMASLDSIDDVSYRDKECQIISKIFADRAHYNEALAVAMKSENTYQRAQAVLYILTRQITPEQVSIQ